MNQKHQRNQMAYSSLLPKGSTKEELEEQNHEVDQQECGEQLMAYRPLPHGPIKEEVQSEDEHGEINLGIQGNSVASPSIPKVVVKQEPTSYRDDEDDDEDGCELVAYSALPHGDIKEEPKVGDRIDGNSVASPSIPKVVVKQEPTSYRDDEDDDEDGCELVAYSALPHGDIKEEPKVGDRIDEFISEIPIADHGMEQLNAEELAMLERDGEKEQQNFEDDDRSDHSSLDGVISTDEEAHVPNHSLAGPAPRKKKSARKPSVKVNHSRGKELLPFKCQNCGKSFKVETYLKQHLATACGIEPKFPCQQCGHQFKRKQQLQKHLMKIHNVEKAQFSAFGAGPKIKPAFPFKCKTCGNTYKQKNSLTKHLKFVCQVDPLFPCNLCDFQSKHKSNLRDHLMNIHNVGRSQLTAFGAAAPVIRPVQSHKCDKCGRTYTRQKNLKRHLAYECGLDPSFCCTQCDHRTSFKFNLKKHLINVHAGAGLSELESKTF